MKLINWFISADMSRDARYLAPEQIKPRLYGTIYGHEEFMDGSLVCVSSPVSYNKDTKEITTKTGHKYVLGKCDSNYLKTYPNARRRLVKSLTDLYYL